MSDTKIDQTVRQELSSIRRELSDIREIISNGFEQLTSSKNKHGDAILEALVRLRDVEEQLAPTFHKVFPKQREFISEVDALLRKPHSR
jgi:dsDNA-specific endonuclease/ATPase MutS2